MPHLPHRCLNASAATTTRFAPLLLMQVFQYRELCARCWRIPVARRMMVHVWRAGEAGIHCSVLCRRTDLTPSELRSLLISMYHGLRRFQRERGVSNQPLQSYFIDPDFAAVASSDMLVEWMSGRL